MQLQGVRGIYRHSDIHYAQHSSLGQRAFQENGGQRSVEFFRWSHSEKLNYSGSLRRLRANSVSVTKLIYWGKGVSIGEDLSDVLRNSSWVTEAVIKPVFRLIGYSIMHHACVVQASRVPCCWNWELLFKVWHPQTEAMHPLMSTTLGFHARSILITTLEQVLPMCISASHSRSPRKRCSSKIGKNIAAVCDIKSVMLLFFGT